MPTQVYCRYLKSVLKELTQILYIMLAYILVFSRSHRDYLH